MTRILPVAIGIIIGFAIAIAIFRALAGAFPWDARFRNVAFATFFASLAGQ